ncbi:MAG TPA: GNAT family N-acetyltransferase [Anaerolineaceae bacterium]
MDFTIETMRPEDWPSVRAIYEEGIDTGCATFETAAPEWEEWDRGHLVCCRLVAMRQGALLGWAALSPFSRRSVYAGVAEVSIYIAGSARGQGVGKALLLALVAESERCGLWTLQAAMFAVNTASQELHRACGFRVVGRRERIAQRDGIWHDTVLMERRSSITGQ